MSDIVITWPRPADSPYPLPAGRRFLASLSASLDVLAVEARCRNVEDGAVTEGFTLSSRWRGEAVHAQHPTRWLILFEGLEGGVYELEATAHLKSGRTSKTLRRFRVEPALPAIVITSHYDNENITDQKDDFLAYGDYVADEPDSATMTEATSSNVINSSALVPYSTILFWTAEFPPIPSGTYTLKVEDVMRSSLDTVTGLKVD